MRILYNFLLRLLFPVFFWISGQKARLTQKRESVPAKLPQFLGFSLPKLQTKNDKQTKCIWIHAASVGEVLAIAPFVRKLLSEFPGYPFLITTMTPTGSARAQALFGDQVFYAYLPFDFPGAVRRFLRHVRPKIGIVAEMDFWPNLFWQCERENIPLALINARLSEKSFQRYQAIFLRKLMCQTLQTVDWIAAQTEADAQRLIALGADQKKLAVTGNIKFDLTISESVFQEGKNLRQQLSKTRPVWIAASTREGEENQILETHQAILKQIPEALLILVPRHPARFGEVTDLTQKSGFALQCRSANAIFNAEMQVYLGDTMGELLKLYAAADVAFVGGSLVPLGGQNMLEPAALGKPVLFGSSRFNFSEISQKLLDCSAVQEVQNAQHLAETMIRLFHNPKKREQMGNAGKIVVQENRGATEKMVSGVLKLISPAWKP